MSRSTDDVTQKKFLIARFRAIQSKPLLPAVSWKIIMENVESMKIEDEEIPFSQRTEQKLKKPSCKILHKILQNLMVRCAGSKALQ